MFNKGMYKRMKNLASSEQFYELIQPTDRSTDNQVMMDFLTRFLVFTFVEYDKNWDIEEYLNNGIIEISESDFEEIDGMLTDFEATLQLLQSTGEKDILRRYKDGKFQGKVGQAAFETIFLGVAQNLEHINMKRDPRKFIIDRAKSLWSRKDVLDFTRAGLRGTDRIKKTIEFGRRWFAA
jgi:hypothetical protein